MDEIIRSESGTDSFEMTRSFKSREKIADTLMDLSTKIWAVIYVAIVSQPLAMVFRLVISEGNANSLSLIINSNGKFYFVILIAILAAGIIMAKKIQKTALDIYDSLERYHL